MGVFVMKFIRIVLFVAAFWIPAYAAMTEVAWAACDKGDSTGVEGEIIYNKKWKVMQFCNGTEWISMAGGGDASATAPSGAIMAFDLAVCPTGWSAYTAAQGRFLRGIDPSGLQDIDGVRTAGSLQSSQIQDHQHNMFAGNGAMGSGIVGNASGYWGSNTGTSGHGQSGFVAQIPGSPTRATATPTETRPANVAVLYCRKD